MITFQLTPSHFAELAWSKMLITHTPAVMAAVPDLVRLLNLERAMLDAQIYEAHRLADLIKDEAPGAAQRMRADADARYRARWTEIGELISALGRAPGPVEVDWTITGMMDVHVVLGIAPGEWDAEAIRDAQRQQVPFLHPANFPHETILALIRAHRTPADQRSPQQERLIRSQGENGCGEGPRRRRRASEACGGGLDK